MAEREGDKFCPENFSGDVLREFTEFIDEFHYIYQAKAKNGWHKDATDDEIKAWKAVNKKQVFLGLHSSRTMQKIYEHVTAAADRDAQTFDQMVVKLKKHFEGNTNTTLANFRFHKLCQKDEESFEAFVMRVRDEAKNCDFKCDSDQCKIKSTLIRDRIIIGTTNDDIRRNALKDQWDLETLVSKGRSLESATEGAATIKQEDKPEIRRNTPGKYAKKKKSSQKSETTPTKPKGKFFELGESSRIKCKTCSNPGCPGDNTCKGRKVECFACNRKGHYKGAAICKKKIKRNTRKVVLSSEDETDISSTSESENSTDSGKNINTNRIRKYISLRRVSGKRIPIRSTRNKYRITVMVREHQIKVFCDTGADACVISKKTAKQLGLEILPTKMEIKPYGSKSKKCVGETVCTITYEEAVTNAKFFVIKDYAETLLSGAVCEDLGILEFKHKVEIKKVDIAPEKKKLMEEFPNVFKNKVGTLQGYKVKFHIDESIPPVYQGARPIPFHLREKLNKELEKMEREEIIEQHEGPAPWVSNLVLAPKDDGAIRVTVDMRQVNKAIKQTHIPIPTVEEIRSNFSGFKVFSKIDFKSAFHQLELDEESKRLTVFHAGDRLMRYKRLTMGSTPASGELTKALAPLFQDIGKGVYIIHDDMIIAGRTKEEHDNLLYEVCKRIGDAGMTLNGEKCTIAEKEIPWWGMIIGEKGVTPNPDKVSSMQYVTPPTTKDELRSFLCMVQSNKDFIPTISRKTRHMRKLLKKHVRFTWDKGCEEEFKVLKSEFKEDTLMRHFDPALKTVIHVDAHQTGMSAILLQGNDEEHLHVVSLASRATTPVESRYPQLDLEALAVDFGLRRFRFYIAGGPQVIVLTDHKPLQAIFKNTRLGSIRTERIKLRHQDLNYIVIWEKGELNIADYLSRHARPIKVLTRDEKEETTELEKTIWMLHFSPYTEAVSIDAIISSTAKDETLKSLKVSLQKGYMSKHNKNLAAYSKVFDELSVSDTGIIMKGEKIILPQSLVKTAISKAHKGGHQGMTTLKRRMRTHFWFPGMDAEIERAVSSCKHCLLFTNKHRKNKLVPHTMKKWNAWEKISVDLFGPMPDKRHILVAQDMVSHFPAAKILNKTNEKKVIDTLGEFYANFGTPMVHRTDNGPPFNSKEFTRFSTDNGIIHEKTFPYHPQANPVETFMRPLGKAMKVAHREGKSKEEALRELLSTYRATPHHITNISPGDMIFRNGYGKDFPKTCTPSDRDIKKSLAKDEDVRIKRDEKKNKTRRGETFAQDDVIYTRNNVRTKFQPLFGPEPRTVKKAEYGGVICEDMAGTIQRRHTDDCKLATDQTDNWWTFDQNKEALEPTTTHNNPILTEPQDAQMPDREEPPRRSQRDRRPNPKYNDYDLNY